MRFTKKDIEARAAQVGLFISSYNPGGVRTRYKVSKKAGQFLALSDRDVLFTGIGTQEVAIWLSGYLHGQESKS